MTERRHLKKLIRDRMARTGESYTAARRRFVTTAARKQARELPPGLVPGYDTFGGGQHRLSALAALHAALDEGRPVYCTVGMTALPWHAREVAHSEVAYEVVVAGRHDGVLYLDDSAVTRTKQGWPRRFGGPVDFSGGLGEYTELCEERLLLMLTGGKEATDELRRLSARIEELTRDYDDTLGDTGRAELFAEFADLVRRGPRGRGKGDRRAGRPRAGWRSRQPGRMMV